MTFISGSLELRIKNLEDKVEKLSNEYYIEKVKAMVYKEIISNNTNIKLDSYLPNIETEIKQQNIENKNFIDDIDQSSVDKHQPIQEHNHIIDDSFKKIKETKTYTKYLSNIKQTRLGLIETMNLKDYTSLCLEHIEILKRIFSEKGFTPKKIKTTVTKSLSPLELRLTRYENYYDSCLDKDEINILKKVIYSRTISPSEYIVLNTSVVQQIFLNYSSVVSSIEETFTNCLINKAGFNNIIYLPLEQSKDSDPYSFYVLDEITNGNIKKWKMDCRLEGLTICLRDSLLDYLISVFRTMYFDIFSDNE